MAEYRFDRQCRTSQSEVYEILEGEEGVGRVDLHYTSTVVYATLILEKDLTEEETRELIEAIDTELADTSDSPREDFWVTVYRGQEVGVYSDEVFEEEEEEGDTA